MLSIVFYLLFHTEVVASFLEYVPSDMDDHDIGRKLEISPEGIPECLLANCDVAVYVMGESQAICDEPACSDFDLRNTDSESESDDMLSVDDGDQVAPGARVTPGCGDTSLMTAPPTACGPRRGTSLRNRKERVRVSKINEKLEEAKELITRSTLIDDDSKKHRWTKLYTLKQLLRLLTILEGKFKKYNRVPHTPRPFARKAAPRGSPKPPNPFIRFSNAMGPSFLAVLKTYLHPGRSKGELQHIPVSI